MCSSRARLLWIVLLLLLASYAAFLIGDHRSTAATRLESGRLFALGMVVDDLILLTGVWLLARSLFADPRTWFFVAVAALGSSLCLGSAASSCRGFHALPLLIHLARRFRASGSSATLFAALNLAGLQALGKPASQALLTPLAALLILAVFRRFLAPEPPVPAPSPDPKLRGLALAAGLLSWIPVAGTLRTAPSGSASSSFGLDLLALGGLDNPGGFLDLLAGIAAVPDVTLYAGFLTLGFALYALACAGPRASGRILGEGLAVLLLLGLVWAIGLLLAPAPPGIRAAAVGAPLWRLLVAFLAGAGFEHWLKRRPAPRAALPLIAGGFLALGVLLLFESAAIPSTMDLKGSAAALFSPRSPASISPIFDDRTTVRELLDTSALWALVAGGLFGLAAARQRGLPLAIALILLLHPLDAFGWKMRVSWVLTSSRFQNGPVGEAAGALPSPWRASTALLGINALLWIAGAGAAAGRLTARPCEPDPSEGVARAG